MKLKKSFTRKEFCGGSPGPKLFGTWTGDRPLGLAVIKQLHQNLEF